MPLIREAIAAGEVFRAHAFELACARAGIDHRTTQPRHPWTNGQVERMNRTLKEATVRRFHYDSHDRLRRHLDDFVQAYSFARRLKTLKGLTPYEFVCKTWAAEPHRFTANPLHQTRGPNIWSPVSAEGAVLVEALPRFSLVAALKRVAHHSGQAGATLACQTSEATRLQ